MTALYERPPKFGKARITMHLEAMTDACNCPRLPSCGGIVDAYIHCPEHGINTGPEVRFHTHAAQVRKTSKGVHRW